MLVLATKISILSCVGVHDVARSMACQLGVGIWDVAILFPQCRMPAGRERWDQCRLSSQYQNAASSVACFENSLCGAGIPKGQYKGYTCPQCTRAKVRCGVGVPLVRRGGAALGTWHRAPSKS